MAKKKGAGPADRGRDREARKGNALRGASPSSPSNNPEQTISGEVLPPRDAKAWAAEINAAWRKSVESIIEAGRLLNQANDDLDQHGQWMPMVEQLDFSISVAERLMRIARHPVLANSTYLPNLPPHWSTLYTLSQLPPERLESLIERGEVNGDTTGRDAELLLPSTMTSVPTDRGGPAPYVTLTAPPPEPPGKVLTAVDFEEPLRKANALRSDWARKQQDAGGISPEALAAEITAAEKQETGNVHHLPLRSSWTRPSDAAPERKPKPPDERKMFREHGAHVLRLIAGIIERAKQGEFDQEDLEDFITELKSACGALEAVADLRKGGGR
jgi:hypothetical protein